MNLLRKYFHNGHGTIVCSCGEIIQSCSCHVGEDNLKFIKNGCEACKRRKTSDGDNPPLELWSSFEMNIKTAERYHEFHNLLEAVLCLADIMRSK